MDVFFIPSYGYYYAGPPISKDSLSNFVYLNHTRK